MNYKRKQMLLHELQERLLKLSHYAAGRGLSHLLFENMAVHTRVGTQYKGGAMAYQPEYRRWCAISIMS